MTDQQIRDFAARHGLAVERRVSTGDARHGFAEYQLTGTPHAVYAAADQWRQDVRVWAGRSWQDFGGCRHSDADGNPYLWASSVWFDDRTPAEVAAGGQFVPSSGK